MGTSIFTPEYLKAVSEIIETDDMDGHVNVAIANIHHGLRTVSKELDNLRILIGCDGEAGQLLRKARKALGETRIDYDVFSSIITGAILNE